MEEIKVDPYEEKRKEMERYIQEQKERELKALQGMCRISIYTTVIK